MNESRKKVERENIFGNNLKKICTLCVCGVVKRIENRVAQVSMLPVGNQEDMQILYYQKNEEYKDHPDFFDNPNAEDGYQRVGTMLM